MKMFNIFHRHRWEVVAFDSGYSTSFPNGDDQDDLKVYHMVTFQKCLCGARRMEVEDRSYIGSAERHKGLVKAKYCWVESGGLQITTQADVYSPDYEKVKSLGPNIDYWEYKPVTEVGKILNQLKNNEEFQDLCKNQMVDDAFGELETTIKLHENIDKT